MPRKLATLKVTGTIKNWYFNNKHELRGAIYNDQRNSPCMDGDDVELSVIVSVSEYDDEFVVKTLGQCSYVLPKDAELKVSPFNHRKIIGDIKLGRKP